ncbi:zinc-ribbon domain-containing protein [Candidatus Methanosphaera massiliense]|uniref:zinc-ribbon domain-containing protein n=1 Tax=Candidatus Methanosphaera massiliense TaxID=3017187 RepID=UPI00389921D0
MTENNTRCESCQKKCPKCYTLNDNNNRFCIKCGEELIYNNIQQNQIILINRI